MSVENREQYQKFGYDPRFLRGTFTEAEFLQYLNFKAEDLAPEPQACKDIKGKQDFSNVASAVAKAIKDRGEHYLFLCLTFLADMFFHFRFSRTRYPSVPGHRRQTTARTRYGHNVQTQHHGCL
jgi:hypothetical protein